MDLTKHKAANQPLIGIMLQKKIKRRERSVEVIVKEERCMFTLPLNVSRLSAKGKQSAVSKFHNLAAHGNKLLAYSQSTNVLSL